MVNRLGVGIGDGKPSHGELAAPETLEVPRDGIPEALQRSGLRGIDPHEKCAGLGAQSAVPPGFEVHCRGGVRRRTP
jgi:hypothetical protein